ncbi:hypothetical protein FOE78_20380 [Microlunatus elymi]|uniref:SurA N-terminal domain-containing protein n=1 Tax=Microlunatus elymi TaxID=2596828 RepID=A0A516Q3D2_9ACTN|nr:hypothetical protein [Microlunatus elymi]QDP97944.1 hypothetical protein FOE78_20380 [Microlunatus elymi]
MRTQDSTDVKALPTRRRIGALIGAAVSGAVLLGGCAQSPADVAVVDGTSITRDQLNTAEAGAQQVSDLSRDQVLSVLIQGQVALDTAAKRGITITDADRDAQLNPAVLQIADAHELAYDLADVQLITKKIGEDEFKKELEQADVTVNPRYGSWDPKQSLTVIPGTGSLSDVAKTRPQQ